MEWLIGLTTGIARVLKNHQRECFLRQVKFTSYVYFWCARLLIPALKLAEINTGCILHCLPKVIGRNSLSIEPFKVEIHALSKIGFTQQRMNHANHFSALVVNRCRVEIVNFLIKRRSNWMRHRASIFRKLVITQNTNIGNTLNRP